MCQAVNLLQNSWDRVQVRQVKSKRINFDRVAFGDEGRVFILETLGVTSKKDYMVDAFGGEFCGYVLAWELTGSLVDGEGVVTLPIPGPEPKTIRARVILLF